MTYFLGNTCNIITNSVDSFDISGSGTAIYIGPTSTWPAPGPLPSPAPAVEVIPHQFGPVIIEVGFQEFPTDATHRWSDSNVMVLSWDAAPYLAYYHLGWMSPLYTLTVLVPFAQQQGAIYDVYSGDHFDPLPVADLLACIPGSVVDAAGFGPWTDEGDGTDTSMPTPWGGQADFTDSRWALPPRPFGTGGWTEKARLSFGAAGGNVAYDGSETFGPGVMTIPIDLTTDLRDGRLCIVFGIEPWFSGDTGAAPNIYPGLTSIEDHRVLVPPTYMTAYWSLRSFAFVEPTPKTSGGPPLRQRQRSLLTASHAAQARTNPVITRARGDY